MADDVYGVRADREAARRVAARVGLAGVPVSLREPPDVPQSGLGTGHWRRHAALMSAAVDRATVTVAQVPPGAVRDQLDGVLAVLRRRLDRYLRIAEIGQALLPDDETTDLDGTAPGMAPYLDGAALEIDLRLRAASAHLSAVAAAIEQIVVTDAGYRAPDEVVSAVGRLVGVPAAP